MKKKLNISSLNVKSFKTTEEKTSIKGGYEKSYYTNCPLNGCETLNYRCSNGVNFMI
ncbi:hypothetical protein AB9P05_02355 [Roseivirga sp. BDSF3-8]|uniref:hypothetical protein n=1 Tax=Roseivirga sp. BDSF3-8 TaxID=3241598 RepID=UPI0035326F2D